MRPLARRELLGLFAASALAGPAFGAGRRPNIVVIVADDLGYGDLGCHGGKDVATPNIDRLAVEGVRMTDFYANHPSCAPSRAAFLSGRYQHRFGFENNPGAAQHDSPAVGLPRDHGGTIAERLKAQGYATCAVGKWHTGFTPENLPTGRGFDRFYGFIGGAMAYTADGPSGDKAVVRGTTPVPMPAHTTEAFTDEAVSFIKDSGRRPFFLYAAYNAVHAPLQSTQPYLARIAPAADPKRRTYLAMLAALDDAVGRIVAAVDGAGLKDDTLVVFTSDNGGPTWQTTSANTPFNGVKGTMLEGGVRVPAIFRWPGRLPAGRVSNELTAGFDITATALALAGAPRTPDLDGIDLMPILTGRARPAPRTLYWRLLPQGAIRSGEWKALFAEDRWWLFDLSKDPGERNDLAAARPEVLARLKADWTKWSATMPPAAWGSLNRTGRAEPGELKGLIDGYVRGLPVDPRSLLYGGGAE
ncbi:sulfatase-like hydrolase/transferase [Phenylobacterium sp.]|uniref:sulfatase family protein n=1 Tax=Phenylobacterium sp. TaxID=1871053 RepID=UPI0025D093B0|nr:sulfatase-like hydrolase/transferase [Phenylobacterium sp.]MBX3485487.1 sulfatase-like hydrolase/transferase [Phenylobacterium sp.]MCW5759088.1 sulfatase-like hydrolase/transferase [Phenylobacterium sp.]